MNIVPGLLGVILTMTLVLARELQKYATTVNVIAPRARTGITEGAGWAAAPDDVYAVGKRGVQLNGDVGAGAQRASISAFA